MRLLDNFVIPFICAYLILQFRGRPCVAAWSTDNRSVRKAKIKGSLEGSKMFRCEVIHFDVLWHSGISNWNPPALPHNITEPSQKWVSSPISLMRLYEFACMKYVDGRGAPCERGRAGDAPCPIWTTGLTSPLLKKGKKQSGGQKLLKGDKLQESKLNTFGWCVC